MGEARGIIWLVGLAGLVWVMWQWGQCRRLKIGSKAKAKVERALRPRTLEDCPGCGEQIKFNMGHGLEMTARIGTSCL